MSHFSVCVIVPDDGVVNNIHANNLEDHLIPVLAPFDEQTEEEKYREFEDRTEEAKADFENDTMRVVRFPDGSIHSIYGLPKECRYLLSLRRSTVSERHLRVCLPVLQMR